jgi:hypothetical protein
MLATPFAAAFSFLAALVLAASLAAQVPAPGAPASPQAPAVDPALPDQLKQLKEWVGEPKMVADFQAIGLIQKLSRDFDARNPKDKERLAKAIGDVFRTGKLRTADKDVLYREASDALGKMGAEGGKELAKAVGDARFKDNVPLQAHMILALGKTEDEKQVDWLVDTATRSVHDELKAAAGEALGNYTSLDIKARREIVKALIRDWGSQHQKATQGESTDPNAPINPDPQNARKTLRAIEGKWIATLTKLTGMSLSAFPDWQRWLNKNPNWTSPAKKP